MKTFRKFSRIALSLLLSFIFCFSYICTGAGMAYAEAHPAAVNGGKTAAEIEAEDLEAFSERTGYDYHDADSGDYAPNELIVQVRSSEQYAASSIEAIEDEFNITVGDIVTSTELETEEGTKASSVSGGGNLLTTYWAKTDEDDIVSLCDRLNEKEEVFNAQPNFKYTICDEESEVNLYSDSYIEAYAEPPAFSTDFYQDKLQWWFDYCNISSAWSGTDFGSYSQDYLMGKGIKVAVIDTGCNTAHEDIVDNLWDNGSGKCGYYAYGKTYISKNDSTMDVNGHGSHCCGTIAMSGKNNVGGIGTAPECQLMVMKADRNTGEGTFYDNDIITSLEKSEEFGADIISMSLGGYNFSYATYQTYQKVSSSCLIVCAAGNDKFDTSEKVHFPSAASCVIGVMALAGKSDSTKLATFSNYDTSGNFYKVAAPGTAIWSLDYTGNNLYCSKQGTSMATPAAVGMIACFMSYTKYIKGLDWTPAQYQYKIESIINSSTYNSLSCGANSQTNHPVAYEKGSSFKVMNLKALFDRYSTYSFSTSAISISNSAILTGIKNATGLSESKLDSCAMKRVSLLTFASESARKGVTDYSDLSKLTGLNYLDLSGATKVTSTNVADVISKCPATLVYLNLTTSSKLGDLSCLASAKFSNLHYLNISSNNLTTLSPIEKFTSLRFLYADSNSIKDISPISGMTHIEHIELSNNQIEDPNPAFASDFANYIDLSHNKLSDHTQLYNYKGAYHSSSFKSEEITLKFDYNNMTGLTSSVASAIKSYIETNNTKSGTLYATTINFTYTNQTTPTSTTPMTSFKIADTTVTREALCSGNLNLNSITGFTAYPSSANKYNYLTWTCSEDGYFSSDGSVLVTADQITSCRTLTLTGTAPAASSATSTVTGTESQTIKLTITAPEIYNAYLSDRVAKTGSDVYISIVTSLDTDRLYLRSGLSDSATTYCYFPMSTVTSLKASDQCKCVIYHVPDSITATAGNYPLYLFAADADGNYTTNSTSDASGKSSYPYKSLGTLYIKDSIDSSAETLNVTYDSKVNRYGQAAVFSVNCGTTSLSPARPEESLSISSTSLGASKYVGQASFNSSLATGFYGNAYSGYPSVTLGTANYKFTIGSLTKDITLETVAPEVKAVEIRNNTTFKTDGYIEYLVKTNTDATTVKAYSFGTTDDICSDLNHLTTTFSSGSGSYANYNSTYNNKLWSVKVPLDSKKALQPVTLVAADPLGDGTVTKTPATGIEISSDQYIYPGENYYKYFNSLVTFLPKDSEGNSAADCCKSVTYSIASSDYFTLTSATTGRVTCDMQKVLESLETSTYTSSRSVRVTATLESGASASKYLYAYRPVVSTLTYDEENSQLVKGGTVYYTAKTYGSDTLYIRNTSDALNDPIIKLTTDDTDSYTTGTDEKGNKYTLWTFERAFESSEKTIKTYARSSYKYSDELTAKSSSYKYLSLTRANEKGDYSSWDAQTQRLTDYDFDTLLGYYGDDTQSYESRLAAVNDYISAAELNYDEDHQEEIESQSASLKNLIDELLGYTDLSDTLEAYAQFKQNTDSAYLTNELEVLAAAQADDSNAKLISSVINSKMAEITELINAVNECEEYISALETSVPELTDNESDYLNYSADSYEALKAKYDEIKAKIGAYEYTGAKEVNSDLAQLKTAFDSLHIHTFVLSHSEPLDEINGNIYMYCEDCDEFFSAVYDEDKYVPSQRYASAEEAQNATEPIPAPFFNIYNSGECDYSLRGASLRLSESDEYVDFDTTQGMRFTASMKVPEGVDFKVGSAGNALTDFGFVFSQTKRLNGGIDGFVIDANDVYKVSVKDKNEGTFYGSNWSGVTYHDADDTMTFNLVIKVKAMNWEEDYCARAYMTYNYNGFEFTVYDSDFSSRSVENIAKAVIADENEPQSAKDFCKNKILDNL